MQAALMENGVTLHQSTCREQVQKAFDNICVGLESQRSGGQALPSTMEKQIADMVKHEGATFPVFTEDVMKCSA